MLPNCLRKVSKAVNQKVVEECLRVKGAEDVRHGESRLEIIFI
jgi:hypothetical protein